MELVTLNSSNQAEKLVENYDSLIWTERYNTVGDFELKAGDVSTFLNLLPEGKAVSLRDTTHTMIVETHLIEREKGKPEKITIKGRSYESILERRVAALTVAAPAADWIIAAKVPSDVAYYIAYRICVLGILDADDIFPTAQVAFSGPADYFTGTGPTRNFNVSKGNLLTRVLELMQTITKADPSTSPATPAFFPRGIKAVKPSSAGTAVTLTWYQGTDRTASVYFDATRSLLDDSKYLFSKVGSSTTAYIWGPASAAKLNKGAASATGLNRRVILVDGTQSGISDAVSLQQQGEISLAEASETSLFDGSINSDLSPYKYGVDYFLGDTVKLVGDYGLTRNAMVTEYIRSEDKNGTRGYPTLAYLS